MPDDGFKIKITQDDIARVQLPQQPVSYQPPMPTSGGPRQWGSVGAGGPQGAAGPGNFFLKGWVYLGIAAFIGAVLAWAICEPTFSDDINGVGSNRAGFGNVAMFPLMVVLMCVAMGSAEGIVEQSAIRALKRAGIGLGLGLVLGFFFSFIANLLYNVALAVVVQMGVESGAHPLAWVARAIAWMLFGVCPGLVYGITGGSGKKILYGIMGGILGAGIGGLVFDPISMAAGGAELSRAVGMGIFGLATGVSVGLVESALKERWLYVSGGPLAGKQFVLYKQSTVVGSHQSTDIYLFKDPTIQPQHATLQLRGAQVVLLASGETRVNGIPVRDKALRSGDTIQIGRYLFQFHEKRAPR